MSKQVVMDSSVALKWVFRDEDAIEQADRMLEDFVGKNLIVIIPTLFDYEIANALKIALVRERLTKEEADEALTDFQQYAFRRYDFVPLQEMAFQLACDHQRSVYDSAYLALAQTQNLWFYTGDLKLFRGVSSTLSWVKWIGDYAFDSIPG